jgi:integrase
MPRPHKVSWHKTRRWVFSVSLPGGKRKHYYASPEIPQTAEGRRRATEWMEGLLRQFADRVVTAGDFTVEDLARAYVEHRRKLVLEGKASAHTAEGHRKHLALICRTPWHGRAFGQVLARELTTRAAAELMEGWAARGKGATTIRNRVGSLQACLNWAAESRPDRTIGRLIAVNPIAGLELPRAEYQGDRYAPADEVEGFLAWVEARARAVAGKLARFHLLTAYLVRFVAETGCRPGEACALEWRHCDLPRRLVVFPAPEHKTGRKTKRPRTLALSPGLVALLESLRADPERHPTHVFTHAWGPRAGVRTEEELRQGCPWNSNALSRRIKELRREAIAAGVLAADSGVRRMHLYRLRHTRITNDLQAGMLATDAAALHGNSVKVIESTYLHHQADHLLDAADRARGGKSGGE